MDAVAECFENAAGGRILTPPSSTDMLESIVGHLGAAISQSLPTDDKIIMEHVRIAEELSESGALAKATGVAPMSLAWITHRLDEIPLWSDRGDKGVEWRDCLISGKVEIEFEDNDSERWYISSIAIYPTAASGPRFGDQKTVYLDPNRDPIFAVIARVIETREADAINEKIAAHLAELNSRQARAEAQDEYRRSA